MKKKIFTLLQYAFFFGLGIFLIWWSVRDLTDIDKSHIRSALTGANYILIVPVIIVLLASHFLRAVRWRLLISSMGYYPSLQNTFFSVMIGYLTNQAVPRLGEFIRCTFLFRYEKIPVDKLIGTVILERIIDVISLLIVFGITLVLQPGIYTNLVNVFFHSQGEQEVQKISNTLILLITAGLVVTIIITWMLLKRKTFSDLLQLIIQIIRRIWNGIGTIRHLKKRWEFLFLSVLIWSLYFVGGYIGFFALKETIGYGVNEAFSILSAGSIGMVATPGGIGAYAVLVQKTMQVYGLNEGTALAFGWLLWLAQTSVILLGGLASFILIPYLNKKK
ncbi:MAG: flippase-like domain-containing protein [Terrimonas sp.]|nr:flippase-like domain-containing protein [Terrimonas sp.]